MALGGIVRGKRTTLRTPTEADLVPIARWAADMRLRHLAKPWHEPAMPATWKERLTEQTKDKESALWMIDHEGTAVGMVLIRLGWEPHRDSAWIDRFLIDPDEWRKGHGWDAALALHRYLFDYLDLRRVSTEARADAVAARRIGERLGYVEFGHSHDVRYRDGAYVDVLSLLMERPAWEERWAKTEREYEPVGG